MKKDSHSRKSASHDTRILSLFLNYPLCVRARARLLKDGGLFHSKVGNPAVIAPLIGIEREINCKTTPENKGSLLPLRLLWQ